MVQLHHRCDNEEKTRKSETPNLDTTDSCSDLWRNFSAAGFFRNHKRTMREVVMQRYWWQKIQQWWERLREKRNLKRSEILLATTMLLLGLALLACLNSEWGLRSKSGRSFESPGLLPFPLSYVLREWCCCRAWCPVQTQLWMMRFNQVCVSESFLWVILSKV